MTDKIKIVGERSKFPYAEVSSSVREIDGLYYWRHSEDIVQVFLELDGPIWKLRNDPDLFQNYDGRYWLKSEMVQIICGLHAPNYIDTVRHNGERVPYGWAVRNRLTNSPAYHFAFDDDVVIDPMRQIMIPTANRVKTSSKVYGNFSYHPRSEIVDVANVDDGPVCIFDTVMTFTPAGDEARLYRHSLDYYDSLVGSVNNAKDLVPVHKVNDSGSVKRGYGLKQNMHLYSYLEPFGELVCKGSEEATVDYLKTYLNMNQGKINSRIKTADSEFSDVGNDENKPVFINPFYERSPGGHVFTRGTGKPVISGTYGKLGGKRYTFGLEYETSAGNLSDVDCTMLNVDKVGDRSIPAFEYVTTILSGDSGLALVKKQCDTLARSCLVNDECSVHIHIGGFGDPRVDSPSFNRMFSVNAIKLGTQIEKELYQISPPSRNPRLKHCKSIREYGDISPANWNEHLASYIFNQGHGPQNDYHFDRRNNAKMEISRWNQSRYRWLNLNHCNTRSRLKTIEFRMFAGTTSYNKVKQYIRICLAFVWAVENAQAVIWGEGYTLNRLIEDAYKKYPQISSEMLAFIKMRKNKFKRTKIYS